MSERDQRRQLAVGAGVSPADPDDPSGGLDEVDLDVDLVQAVADLVDDLVDGTDTDPGASPLT